MHKYLTDKLPKGTGVNFVAHSMGGLDVRYLISNIKPTTYTPLTLTSIGTPHRGSPFMDWCAANIGVGYTGPTAKAAVEEATRKLPYSLKSPLLARTEQALAEGASLAGFTSAMSRYLLSIFDSPAYSNLTTSFLQEFNAQVPDDPNVKYISVAGRTSKMSVLHPLWFPKLVLDAAAEKGYPADDSGKDYEGNDGLVSVKSAKWGEYIGAVDDTHHWDLRGEGGIWPNGLATEDPGMSKDKAKEGKKEKDGLILPGAWDWADDVEEYLGLNLLTSSDKKDKKSDKGVKADGNGKDKKEDGGWDIAQVGQLLDWVTDALPGSKTTESGKRQIQEARDERDNKMSGKKDGKKQERDKFDLAKFYGGLMLKLRDDGF